MYWFACSHVSKPNSPVKVLISRSFPRLWTLGLSRNLYEKGSFVEVLPKSSWLAKAMTPLPLLGKSRTPRRGKKRWFCMIPPGALTYLLVESKAQSNFWCNHSLLFSEKHHPQLLFDGLESSCDAWCGNLAHWEASSSSDRMFLEDTQIALPYAVDAIAREWSLHGIADQSVRLCVGDTLASSSSFFQIDHHTDDAQPESGLRFGNRAHGAFSSAVSGAVDAIAREWSLHGIADQSVRLCVGDTLASSSSFFQIDHHTDDAQPESGLRFGNRAHGAFSSAVSGNVRILEEIHQFGIISPPRSRVEKQGLHLLRKVKSLCNEQEEKANDQIACRIAPD